VKWKTLEAPARGPDPHVARNAHRLTDLLSAVTARTRAKSRVLAYLHDQCRLIEDNTERARKREDVADWLLAQAAVLGARQDPVPGIGGRLLSSHHNGKPEGMYFVWTFADGRVSKVDVHASYGEALQAAGLVHAD
jgi:hypothetical protein